MVKSVKVVPRKHSKRFGVVNLDFAGGEGVIASKVVKKGIHFAINERC